MRKLIFIIVVLLALPAKGQSLYTAQDSLILEKYMNALGKKRDLPSGKLIVETALYFRGRPYVASTLEKGEREQLVVNLREFDCTTFVETCMALAKAVKTNKNSFGDFCALLQNIRYRNGSIEDYSSRLHYVSDWTYDNCRRNNITDITKEAGGICEAKELNFMTEHPDSYIRLKNNKEMQRKMREAETEINNRGGYYYIPKRNIPEAESQIKDGDIVVFATSIDGLDYSHIGIAYRTKGRLTFVHASSRTKTVIVEPLSLYDYCMKSSKCTGITVLRINE